MVKKLVECPGKIGVSSAVVLHTEELAKKV
jgi:hypothetical protein